MYCVQSSEIGKVFALISCAEPVSSLIGTVVFSTVYRLTFDRIYPGFVFALEVAFFVCLFCALVALWYDIRRCAASPYGALMEETQLRSAAFTAPIDGRLAVASSAAEAKAATRSSESLTEIMNAWPQQHDYGTAADSNSSSRLCQSGVPHQDATESDELRRDDVIDGRDVVDGDPGRHRSRNGYGVGRRQHFGPANDQSHDVTGIRGADVDSRQWS